MWFASRLRRATYRTANPRQVYWRGSPRDSMFSMFPNQLDTRTNAAFLVRDNATYRCRKVIWAFPVQWRHKLPSVSRPCTEEYVTAWDSLNICTVSSRLNSMPPSSFTVVSFTVSTVYATPLRIPCLSMGTQPRSSNPGQIHILCGPFNDNRLTRGQGRNTASAGFLCKFTRLLISMRSLWDKVRFRSHTPSYVNLSRA